MLDSQDGQIGLRHLEAASTLQPFGVYARPDYDGAFVPIGLEPNGIVNVNLNPNANLNLNDTYDLTGRRVSPQAKGLVITRNKEGKPIKLFIR